MPMQSLFCGLKLRAIEKEIVSCHVIIGYIIEGICLLGFIWLSLQQYKYQMLILCLPAHHCVQGHSFI